MTQALYAHMNNKKLKKEKITVMITMVTMALILLHKPD
jgi:hypothetical protein